MSIIIKNKLETNKYISEVVDLEDFLERYCNNSINTSGPNAETSRFLKTHTKKLILLRSILASFNSKRVMNQEENKNLEHIIGALLCLIRLKIDDIKNIYFNKIKENNGHILEIDFASLTMTPETPGISQEGLSFLAITENMKSYPDSSKLKENVGIIIKNSFLVINNTNQLVISEDALKRSRSKTPLSVALTYLKRYKELSTEEKLESFNPKIEEVSSIIQVIRKENRMLRLLETMVTYKTNITKWKLGARNELAVEKLKTLIKNLEDFHLEAIKKANALNGVKEEEDTQQIDRFLNVINKDIELGVVSNVLQVSNSNTGVALRITLAPAPIKFIDLNHIVKVYEDCTPLHKEFLNKVKTEEYVLYNGALNVDIIAKSEAEVSSRLDRSIFSLAQTRWDIGDLKQVVNGMESAKSIDFHFKYNNDYICPQHLIYYDFRGCRGGYATLINKFNAEGNLLGVYSVMKDFTQTVNLFDGAGITSLSKLIICDKDGYVKYIPSIGFRGRKTGVVAKDLVHINELYRYGDHSINLPEEKFMTENEYLTWRRNNETRNPEQTGTESTSNN